MRCKIFSHCWSVALANFVLALTLATGASAATEKVLYSFGNGTDAAYPFDTPIFDAAGNIYGTTWEGGTANHGTVWELSPASGGGWTETVLYSFQGGPTDGGKASGSLIFDAAGNIYGTTRDGGSTACSTCGTVFELTPNNGTWTETLLYEFTGVKDGKYPYAGVIMDGSGNLYGMTNEGGSHHFGTVFELSPSNGGWTESTLLTFDGKNGNGPVVGLTIDAEGNLYGTTQKGGAKNLGVVFELSPSKHGWKETVLHSFTGGTTDGSGPGAGVIFDTAGNLYGTTYAGGTGSCTNGCGTVFELSPSSGGWTETIIQSLADLEQSRPNGIVFDAAGNLYGATRRGGTWKKCTGGGCGTVFELTPSNGTWTETILYSFKGIPDGAVPFSGPIVDAEGNVYGTTVFGGKYHPGVVYEILP
jgi:uncharacterized repeat protein (TIGR03803 family)